jgi:hypothetical protein
VTVNGPFTWSGGTINNTVGVTLNGASSLSGANGTMYLYGLLINAGTLTWSGSSQNFNFYSGTLTNLASGKIIISADVSAYNAGGGTIVNAGVLKKTGGTGTSTLGVALVNSGGGIVQAQSGTLDLAGGGSASGTFEVSANATLQFGGGTYMLSSGSVTGAGTVLISSAGTVNVSGTYSVSGTTTIGGGTLTVNASTTMTTLNLSSGTLGGSGSVTVNGPFTWSGGTINNTVGVTLNGASSLSDVSIMQLSGPLINAGTLTWSGSGANFNYSSALNNLINGKIIISVGATTLNVALVNSGDVQVQSGTLDLTGGGSASGTFEVSANATLQFGGSYTLGSLSSVSGAGTVLISSAGTLTVNAPATMVVTNLNLSGGTLSGSGSVTVNGPFNFSVGTLTGSGSVTVNGPFNFSGGNLFGNVSLTVNGPFTWSGGTINNTVGVTLNGPFNLSGGNLNRNVPLVVNGPFDFSSGTLGGSGSVTVNGPFTWSGGTINNTVGVTLNGTNSLSGVGDNTMQLNSLLINAGPLSWGGNGANFYFSSGTLTNIGAITITADVSSAGSGTIVNAGMLKKTGGTGTSTLTVVLVNSGTLDAQSGTISLTGGYSLTNGTLNFGISSLASFGKINLSGVAALTGTLSANLNGGYIPNSTNSFAVLSYGSETGTFTSTNLPFADAWQVIYGSNAITLQVSNARPTIATLTTQVVKELTLLTVTNTATDLDKPAQTLTFSLISAPNGMTLTPFSTNAAVISWTPAQTNSPSTNTVSVSVTDNGTPPLSATNTFLVIVREVNMPPTLSTNISTQFVNVLTLLTVTNTATNTNIHSTITGYRLVNPPTNMVISANGIITWTPSQSQGPSTNIITTVVTNFNPYDLVNPNLTATNSFTVIVLAPTPVFLTNSWNGSVLTLSWSQGMLLQATNLLGPWVTNGATESFAVQPSTNGPLMFYRVKVQ